MLHEVIDRQPPIAATFGGRETRPLRILHIMRTPVGGLFRHVRDLARCQSARGHHVGVICDGSTRDHLTEDRLRALGEDLRLGLIRMPMRRNPAFEDRTIWHAVADLAVTLRADILHGHGAKGGAYARLARRLLVNRGHSVASIYTPHGGTLHYQPTHPVGWLYIRIERLLAASTDGLVFESAYARKIYETRVRPQGVETRVIYNGIQPAEFDRITPDQDAADFLYLGEMRDIKGVDVLLKSFAKVNAAQPARLVLFGDGPDREGLEALARQLAIVDRITFHPATPIRTALARGRVMVVPSRAESMPYVVLETAAAGVPLIATRVGGIPEIVAGSDTGLIPPDNVDALAGAMAAERADLPASAARAERLRAAMEGRFTVDTMTDDILAFYEAARMRANAHA